MKGWPPRYEDAFPLLKESGKPPHYGTVRKELIRSVPLYTKLPNHQKLHMEMALYAIDEMASIAHRRLRNSKWSAEQLFKLSPPFEFDGRAKGTAKRNYDRWLRDREHQLCISLCWSARAAILADDWGKAIHDALNAGAHYNGALARSAIGSRQGRIRKIGVPTKLQIRAQKARSRILAEATALRSKRNSWSTSRIAKHIGDDHKAEENFPRYEAIRKILRNEESWESSARIPTNS